MSVGQLLVLCWLVMYVIYGVTGVFSCWELLLYPLVIAVLARAVLSRREDAYLRRRNREAKFRPSRRERSRRK